MLMNDSGNESEERLFFDHLDKSGLLDEPVHSDSEAESDIYSKVNEFDVVFQDPGKLQSLILPPSAELLVDDGAPPPPVSTKPRDVRRILTSDNSTDSCTSSIVTTSGGSAPEDDGAGGRPNAKLTQINTCKILQRKLELKVERAKRNYRQMYEEQDLPQDPTPKSAPLIPISRLPIPGGVLPRDVQQPLVDVAGTASDDEDDLEQVSFFPRPMKKSGAASRQELSDTFSIQEMTIESDQEDEADYERCRKLSNSKGYKRILNRGLSAEGGDYLDNDATGDYDDEDDDDSQNLELLPPKSGYNLRELAQRAFCCFRRQDFLS